MAKEVIVFEEEEIERLGELLCLIDEELGALTIHHQLNDEVKRVLKIIDKANYRIAKCLGIWE